jgi:hypothetical protein
MPFIYFQELNFEADIFNSATTTFVTHPATNSNSHIISRETFVAILRRCVDCPQIEDK